MSFEEIGALVVPAAKDSLLLLWGVNNLLPEALEVMRRWGFQYRANLVWVKPSPGIGAWFRNRHELLLLGRRFPCPDGELRAESVLEAPRGRHSEKPQALYELIERMYPQASKLELFARKQRPGWAAFGNEIAP